MAYKKISQLPEATEVNQNDLLLISDILGSLSKKLPFSTLSTTLNTPDLNGRFQEGTSYTINRDAEGLVSTITTTFGTVTKTFTFTRDIDSFVSSVNIANSDASFNKTYTFNRDSEGVVTSVTIS